MVESTQQILDRKVDPVLYSERLNSNISQKSRDIIPYILEYIKSDNPKILSLGAGTGVLESEIAQHLSGSTVTGIDLDYRMIEDVGKESQKLRIANTGTLIPLRADINYLPLTDNVAEAVIASSVVHEVISRNDNFQPGETTGYFFGKTGKLLKNDGIFIFRDFMLPGNPDKQVFIQIGKQMVDEEMDPYQFLKIFSRDFRARDLSYIYTQLKHLKKSYGKYLVAANLKDAMEILVHYSWSGRLESEIEEMYFPFTVKEYPDYIIDCWKKHGVNGEFLKGNLYLQNGYTEHISGRLDMADPVTGNLLGLPEFNGVAVFRKLA